MKLLKKSFPYYYLNSILICVFLLLCLNVSIQAQSKTNHGFGLQLKYGYANTFHYNAPTPTPVYIEGTNYFKQYPRVRAQFDITIIKPIFKNQAIKAGIGLSSYSFYQEREDVFVIGLPSYPIIKETFNYYFISYFLGIRHQFNSDKKLRPFIDVEVHYDKNFQKEFSVKQGLALKSGLGLSILIGKQISFISDFFYKSAITPYNLQENYYPYMWGFEIGFIYHL